MSTLSEKLKKCFEEKKLDEKDYKDILDSVVEAETKSKENEDNLAKVTNELEERKKMELDFDNIKKQVENKDKEIINLQMKYIESFENGKKKDEEEKKDINSNPDIKINDLIEEIND